MFSHFCSDLFKYLLGVPWTLLKSFTTCETSQVLLAGVSGGFPGVLPFRPTYRLARLDMSEIILKGTLN